MAKAPEYFILLLETKNWDLYLSYSKNETQRKNHEPPVSEVLSSKAIVIYSAGTPHKKSSIIDLRLYTDYNYMYWDFKKDEKFVDREKPDNPMASINYYELMRRLEKEQKRINGSIFDKNIALIHVPIEISNRVTSGMCKYVQLSGHIDPNNKKSLPVTHLSFHTYVDMEDWIDE